jgi:transposase
MSRTAVLDDAAWARVEPLLPSSQGCPGRPYRDHRQVVEGIIYRYRTGIPWRDLPEVFGPWQTVWKRHRRYSLDGTWDLLLTKLLTDADAAGKIDWQVSVDSTIARVHQHGATARRSQLTATSHTGGSVE